MNFLKRAAISIKRNPGKTIILLLIVFVLGTVISGAISVSQAIQNTQVKLKGDLPAVATIEVNHNALMEQQALTGEWPEDIGNLTSQMLNEIGALPQVKIFDYSAESSMMSTTLERYYADESMMRESGMGDWEYFSLRGMRTSNPFEIDAGQLEIDSGRMFTAEEVGNLSYVALISKYFAEQNSLHIGSTFTLENVVWDYGDNNMIGMDFYTEENIFAKQSHDFEVVGIFMPKVEFNTGDEWMDKEFSSQMENRIYVPNPVAIATQTYNFEKMREMTPDEPYYQEDPESLMWYSNIYLLNDTKEMDSFKQAVAEIVPEFYAAITAGDNYGNVSSSMDSLSSLASAILVVAVGAAVLILSLLITLFLRERKREMGILLALGERKGKVITQMMCEVLLVAVIAIVLSLFVGHLLSGTISEAMLKNDLLASNAMNQGMSFGTLDYMGYSNNVSASELLETYNVSLTATTILIFYAIGIATVVIATIVPMFYIVRLNPKRILM